jgi:single-stranded DNA-binding protein
MAEHLAQEPISIDSRRRQRRQSQAEAPQELASPPGVLSPADSWDITSAAKMLEAKASSYTHPQLGEGIRLTLDGQNPNPSLLDLYPERLIARFKRGALSLNLGSVDTFQAHKGGWMLHSRDEVQETSLFLESSGGVAVAVIPMAELEDRQARELPELAAAKSKVLSPPVEQAQEAQGTNRVRFTGRVGKAPRHRVTPNGTVRTSVLVGVDADEKMDWKTVVYFGEPAQQALDLLEKGQIVSVIGYSHERSFTDRFNKQKIIREINNAYTVIESDPERPAINSRRKGHQSKADAT